MRTLIRLALCLCLALAAMARGPADSGESDNYMWLQYGADGRPHVRVIPSDRASCPLATADGLGVTMTVAVVASVGFDRVLCDAALPRATQLVHVAGATMPPLPRHIARFVVLGDTGCRIEGAEIQNCRDAQAWPFARIAQAIAREEPRPDLIVHLGDYAFRESPCPAADVRCAGSPYGDNWSTWAVDFFEPGAALFTTAPIVWVRGDREQCARAGLGWSRYLAPEAKSTCRTHDDPTIVTFADLRLVNVDSAAGDTDTADPAAFEHDEQIADDQAGRGETFLLTHRIPPADLGGHPAADPNGAHPAVDPTGAHPAADPNGSFLAAIITGQDHLFAALPFAGAPPTIIVGTGGDTLATTAVPPIQAVVHATSEARFGYAVFDRVPGGWSISERDPDGSEHRRCELRARTVHC